MNERKLAFLYSPKIEALSYPPDCPFKLQRAGLVRLRLKSLGLIGDKNCFENEPRCASIAEMEQFHTAHYLQEMQRAMTGDLTADGFRMGFGGPDTPVFKDMFACGAWGCGAGLTGAELLLRGEADIVFNLLGGFHHAFPELAAGFCYLNDVVLACMKLAGAGKRVLYLDVDAHHGDGVQAAFYGRKDVMTISLHESGKTLFPWGGFEDEMGEGDGHGFNVNVPLPAETYDEAYLRALDSVAMPLAAAFGPDVLVLELGMDILAGDPLTHLRMTNNVVVEIAKRVLNLNCPVLVAGGGGYHVENTVRGWALAWRTFSGDDEDSDFGMGGVMLESTEWAGGLRDRVLAVPVDQRRAVEPPLQATIQTIVKNLFPLHGLEPSDATGPAGTTVFADRQTTTNHKGA
jgi:acetoin utilization protein AcuC